MTPPTALPIEPSFLKDTKPVELSTLVLDAMPSANSTLLGWDHMLHAPVHWITDGFETTETGAKVRDGFARVRVSGRVSTVLKQTKEELPWRVELDSTTNENFGPQEISIEAGDGGVNDCFGSLIDGCTFTPEEAFNSPSLRVKFLCQIGEANAFTRYYRVMAPGRATMIAAHRYGEGSGGASAEITLTLASNQAPSTLSDDRPACAASHP